MWTLNTYKMYTSKCKIASDFTLNKTDEFDNYWSGYKSFSLKLTGKNIGEQIKTWNAKWFNQRTTTYNINENQNVNIIIKKLKILDYYSVNNGP